MLGEGAVVAGVATGGVSVSGGARGAVLDVISAGAQATTKVSKATKPDAILREVSEGPPAITLSTVVSVSGVPSQLLLLGEVPEDLL
jgi:hypothetical protein